MSDHVVGKRSFNKISVMDCTETIHYRVWPNQVTLQFQHNIHTKSVLKWIALSSMSILQCPLMQVVKTAYSTPFECCLISPHHRAQKDRSIYNFTYKPLITGRENYCPPLAVVLIQGGKTLLSQTTPVRQILLLPTDPTWYMTEWILPYRRKCVMSCVSHKKQIK
jgi:hypothetical protein